MTANDPDDLVDLWVDEAFDNTVIIDTCLHLREQRGATRELLELMVHNVAAAGAGMVTARATYQDGQDTLMGRTGERHVLLAAAGIGRLSVSLDTMPGPAWCTGASSVDVDTALATARLWLAAGVVPGEVPAA